MPLVTRTWKVAGKPCLNPVKLEKHLGTTDPLGWFGKANGLVFPNGRQWGSGDFLVSAEDFAGVEIGSTVEVTVETEAGTYAFPNQYVIRVEAASRSTASPARWLRTADRRWAMEKSTANKRYNLRTGPGDDDWLEDSLNGGTPWTWEEVLEDLAGELPHSVLTTLTSAPGSTPENLVFDGVNAWLAFCQVAHAVNHEISINPFIGSFRLAHKTGTQGGLAAQKSANEENLLWLFSPSDLGQSVKPAKVRCTFPKLPETDQTAAPFFPEPHNETATVGSGISGTEFPIIETMWKRDDPDNSAAVTARCAEVGQAIDGHFRPYAQPWGAIYTGIVDFINGEEITQTEFRNDGHKGTVTAAKFIGGELCWPKPAPLLGLTRTKILYTIVSVETHTATSHYNGLKVATVRIAPDDVGVAPCHEPHLLGEIDIEVVDHSGCLFNEANEALVDRVGWAFWGVSFSLKSDAEEGDLAPCHWVADGLCC